MSRRWEAWPLRLRDVRPLRQALRSRPSRGPRTREPALVPARSGRPSSRPTRDTRRVGGQRAPVGDRRRELEDAPRSGARTRARRRRWRRRRSSAAAGVDDVRGRAFVVEAAVRLLRAAAPLEVRCIGAEGLDDVESGLHLSGGVTGSTELDTRTGGWLRRRSRKRLFFLSRPRNQRHTEICVE